jgi:hypothetical protein
MGGTPACTPAPRHTAMRTLAIAILALAAVGPARAADYWVANGGDDAHDGLAPASAWATLQHAASIVAAGDTVHVVDGSYQGFDLRSSGASGSPITFRAEGTAARITADNGVTPDGINVENAAWVVIDGFVVDDRTRAGIRVAVSQFVTVRNCRTGHNGHWGIFSGFADDLVIEDNEAHDSQLEHGIYVSNSGDRPVIRRNHVHDNHANGIHMNGDASQGGDGLISNALVERNVIHGNGVGGGSGINMDGVTDSVVQNNLLYDNHASGISLYRIDGAAGSSGNRVVNNTILTASDGRWCVNINSGSTGNVVENNVLYDDHPFRGVIEIDASSRPGFVSDYNSVMDRFSTDSGDTVIGLAAWQALGYDAHSFLATPADLFLVPGTDFHLLAGAPAVDAGTAAGAPSLDLDGGPRPVGAGVDVGAYELQLLHCGDGNVDPGEQCGEPGLGCTDPCTSCRQCICSLSTPVCGDGLVCGAEECEGDADCAPGATCAGCRCTNPPVCTSGIPLASPRLRLRAAPGLVRVRGDAVVPKPWTGIDPPANGIRLVVDSPAGAGGIDVTVPGGAGWRTTAGGTRWTFVDPAGAHAGIRELVVRDRSRVADGLLRIVAKGKGGTLVLPPPTSVRTAVVFGAAAECAALTWNPPAGSRPRCTGDATRLTCR